MLPPGMESTAEAVLMVGEGIRVSGKDSLLKVLQPCACVCVCIGVGGWARFLSPCDQRQSDS